MFSNVWSSRLTIRLLSRYSSLSITRPDIMFWVNFVSLLLFSVNRLRFLSGPKAPSSIPEMILLCRSKASRYSNPSNIPTWRNPRLLSSKNILPRRLWVMKTFSVILLMSLLLRSRRYKDFKGCKKRSTTVNLFLRNMSSSRDSNPWNAAKWIEDIPLSHRSSFVKRVRAENMLGPRKAILLREISRLVKLLRPENDPPLISVSSLLFKFKDFKFIRPTKVSACNEVR